MADIQSTLAGRKGQHGDFTDNARISDDLHKAMRRSVGWDELTHVQRQALLAIQCKVARILSGDPSFADHWHDIQGYAKLAEDRL